MMEFLAEIKENVEYGSLATAANVKTAGEIVAFSDMVNILIMHSQSHHVALQIMAARWIHEFVRL